MPHASPNLRRLRQRTGTKTGPWADAVDYNRNQYVNVESGRRSASPEFFARCAIRLTQLLGERIDPEVLMATGDEDDSDSEHEHTDAGTGPPNRGDSTGPGRLHPGMRAAS